MPPPPRKQSFGLFGRVLVLALLVSVVPLVGLGFVLVDQNAEALRTSARTLHLSIAQDVQRSVRAHLGRIDEELLGIGQLLLAPGLGSDDARVALAGAKVTASAAFDAVTLYGPDGARIGTIKAREAADPDVPDQLFDFKARDVPVAGATLAPPPSLRHAALRVREVRATAQGPRGLVERDIEIAGQLRGKLVAWTRLDALCALVGELGELRLGARDAVSVVDGARRVVLDADASQVGSSREGRGIFRALAGNASFAGMPLGVAPDFDEGPVAMLGALEPLQELDWAVVVREPRAQAYATLHRMRRAVLLFVGTTALLAALVAGFTALQLSRPLLRLVGATRAIAERRFEGVGADVAERSDEVGELGRAFDGMARDLAGSEARLVQETRVRASLSRYLSPDVVDLIVQDPNRMRLQGERREVTVLFADVVSFTGLAEKLPAETIVQLLNELFTAAGQIVQERGGIIDKFIGDCVMAVWGTPEAHADDPARAVAAGEALIRFLRENNPRFLEKYGVEIHLSIGINTGPAVAGNLGGEARMEYTVIGDAVNIAARLQGIAGKDQIVISDATAARVRDGRTLHHLGDRVLKGRSLPTPLYEVTT